MQQLSVGTYVGNRQGRSFWAQVWVRLGRMHMQTNLKYATSRVRPNINIARSSARSNYERAAKLSSPTRYCSKPKGKYLYTDGR